METYINSKISDPYIIIGETPNVLIWRNLNNIFKKHFYTNGVGLATILNGNAIWVYNGLPNYPLQRNKRIYRNYKEAFADKATGLFVQNLKIDNICKLIHGDAKSIRYIYTKLSNYHTVITNCDKIFGNPYSSIEPEAHNTVIKIYDEDNCRLAPDELFYNKS